MASRYIATSVAGGGCHNCKCSNVWVCEHVKSASRKVFVCWCARCKAWWWELEINRSAEAK